MKKISKSIYTMYFFVHTFLFPCFFRYRIELEPFFGLKRAAAVKIENCNLCFRQFTEKYKHIACGNCMFHV